MDDIGQQEQVDREIERRLHHSEFLRHHSEYHTALILRHTVYRARVGKRTAFPSSYDAGQYERGFASFPTQPWGLADSPAMQGYLDAEAEAAARLAAQPERRDFEIAS